MTETTPEVEVAVEAEVTYSESFVFERPIQTVGRRKEAVVRVRLVPGSGKFDLNGRSSRLTSRTRSTSSSSRLRWSPSTGWRATTSLRCCTAAAPRVKPARCGWVSPGH